MNRIGLFISVNILVMVSISIITLLLGFSSAPLIIVCLVWGMGGSLVSLLLSKKMAKWFMGVQLISLEGPHKNLVEMTHRLSRRAGLTEMPEVGIYQSDIINAFATGPSRNNSLVAISTGLLRSMSEIEIEGVLGHEVSHIANGDMVTLALIQGVMNAFVMFLSRILAFIIGQSMRNNDDRDTRSSPFIQTLLIIVLEILIGILASPIIAWFSRYREFHADRGGADLAGKEKMLAALNALKRTYEQMEMNKEEINPSFRSMQISSKSGFLKLLSTHPPLEERIRALQGSWK
jgi:heat shock protein HtpX